MSQVPKNLKYTEEHEWVSLDEDGVATVGITDFAQESLGDIVYVELPEVGTKVEQGDSFVVVESVKAASEVYSPVSGEVVAVNGALNDNPEQINNSPYDHGWLVKIEAADSGEVDDLMSAAIYKQHVE